ncbi:hypothetical protein B296_00040268 [Ensete ventricosum]|uniref:B box-type domain-containing protein n=1 Tax=Ensete ventricosum TaxID=4639 RepID=A0A426YSG3_ENSVE|nr:hypothetical protein B296_00040268 [Ensete ventricosum]
MSFTAVGVKPGSPCELCGGGAAVHCEADAASLCWACDARVHGANFLVARHLRRVACACCHSLDDDRVISGASSPPVRSICRSCGPDAPEFSSSASSPLSSCVSTADSKAGPEDDMEGAATSRVEGGWRRRWARRRRSHR